MAIPDAEVVDKSLIVIGGFAADALDDAEQIVRDMLAGMDGFREVDMAGSKQDIALASLGTPQKSYAVFQIAAEQPNHEISLGAAENRPRSKRARCKIVNKITKFMIEIGGAGAKDGKVN